MNHPELVEQVRQVDAGQIALPVLRGLVQEIQTKSTEQIQRDSEYWNDTKWNQWRQHSSHNPW